MSSCHSFPARQRCKYASCYCEENAWWLCKELVGRSDGRETAVVVVSNPRRTVPLWRQRAAKVPTEPVVWDYHVFVVSYSASDVAVLDLDTTVGFPARGSDYAVSTFCPEIKLRKEFRRLFRVVSGPEYLRSFSSDRSHMRAEDGSWMAPPPEWDLIRGEGASSSHTLPAFWTMAEREDESAAAAAASATSIAAAASGTSDRATSAPGRVADEEAFFAALASAPAFAALCRPASVATDA